MIVSGLRRTGKTTILKHTISQLSKEEFDKCAYIDIEFTKKGVNFNNVNYILGNLYSKGFRIFFIDEATCIKDIITKSKILSDKFCTFGCKIILSESNSLAFEFAKSEPLCGRYYEVKTTWISYGEWAYLLYSEYLPDIEQYLKYGGILSREKIPLETSRYIDYINNTEFKDYIETSIITNFLNTLTLNEFFLMKKNWNILQLNALFVYGDLLEKILYLGSVTQRPWMPPTVNATLLNTERYSYFDTITLDYETAYAHPALRL